MSKARTRNDPVIYGSEDRRVPLTRWGHKVMVGWIMERTGTRYSTVTWKPVKLPNPINCLVSRFRALKDGIITRDFESYEFEQSKTNVVAEVHYHPRRKPWFVLAERVGR